MPELLLTCPECQVEFPFSEEAQAYCEANAFPPPSRCPDCQRARKTAKAEANKPARGGHRRRR